MNKVTCQCGTPVYRADVIVMRDVILGLDLPYLKNERILSDYLYPIGKEYTEYYPMHRLHEEFPTAIRDCPNCGISLDGHTKEGA